MRSPRGDHAGKLSYWPPVFSDVISPFSIDRIISPRPCFPSERYTMRLPSGDQLGKPLFVSPPVIVRKPEPSGLIRASWAAGPVRKKKVQGRTRADLHAATTSRR